VGWTGLIVPESHGGAGLGFAELGIVFEELGRSLAASPMLATSVIGARALLLGGSEEQKAALLPRLSTGDCLFALALDEQRQFAPHAVETRAAPDRNGFRLTGRKGFVLDGHIADKLIVVARTAGSAGERAGLTLFLVDRDRAGVRIDRLRTLDGRNAAIVTLDDVGVERDAVLGSVDGGQDLLDAVLDGAAGALSAEMLGTMSAAFEITLEYMKVRRQFGALIGSFQALKHRAATMFVDIELNRSLVVDALRALDESRPDCSQSVSAAKARVSHSLVHIANEAIQLHGGIGMTEEHDIGLYLKRARVAQHTFGDDRYHWKRFASLRGF
jgi:alkylation response protein AidB-like acyl-CoA dehydrogenase